MKRHGQVNAVPDSGFTLLEVLVVLALIAALGALVVPATAQRIAAMQAASDFDRSMAAVAGLPLKAALSGESWVIDSTGARPDGLGQPSTAQPADVGLPPGWRVVAEPAIRIHKDGFCDGGQVTVLGPDGERREIQVERGGCAEKRS